MALFSDMMDEACAKDAEIARLRAAVAAIQKATVEGRVCDDVACRAYNEAP